MPLYLGDDFSEIRVVEHSPKAQLRSTSRKILVFELTRPCIVRSIPPENADIWLHRGEVFGGEGGRGETLPLALWGLVIVWASAAFGLRLLLQAAGGPGPAVPALPLSGLRAPRDQLSRGFGPPRLQRRARAAKPALAAGAAGSAAPAASAVDQPRAPRSLERPA